MKQSRFFVICNNIRSRENVGSVFRTADAFGVDKIFLTGYTPAPPHEKISKTALGAEQWMPWEKVYSVSRLITRLKKEGFEIVALEQSRKSIDIGRYRPSYSVRPHGRSRKKNIALIIGNEVKGIPPSILKKCDKIIEVPVRGKMVRHAHHPKHHPERGRGKESLNVAVAFGVAAYIMSQRLQK